jgi:iodotyrosine deiodinase
MHAVSQVILANKFRMFARDEENLAKPFLREMPSFRAHLFESERHAQDPIIPGKTAVTAIVNTFVRKIERREEAHGASEILQSESVRALRHLFQGGVRRGRKQRFEALQERRLLERQPIEYFAKRHYPIISRDGLVSQTLASHYKLRFVKKDRFIALEHSGPLPNEQLRRRSSKFEAQMQKRRTVRKFSERPVPREIIEDCLRVAGSAPSGANLQPWHFVAINNSQIKHEIRVAAEAEEKEFYDHRAPSEWLEAPVPLGTDWHKPFLETAPWLIAIFSQPYRMLPDGRKLKHYYATESVGIASGFLVAAIHLAGLASLTHTANPMTFLNRILKRPSYEKPFLLLVVGHPAKNATVPDIKRKALVEIASFLEEKTPEHNCAPGVTNKRRVKSRTRN